MVEKLPQSLAERTREEWRELGFFYCRDDATKEWRLTGSPSDLLRFINLLREYAGKESNLMVGEHDHLGPHMYLTIQTAEEPDITDRAIYGRLPDIARLAGLLGARLQLAGLR